MCRQGFCSQEEACDSKGAAPPEEACPKQEEPTPSRRGSNSCFPCLPIVPLPCPGLKGPEDSRELLSSYTGSRASELTFSKCLQMNHPILPRNPPLVNFPGRSDSSVLCNYLFICLCFSPVREPLGEQTSSVSCLYLPTSPPPLKHRACRS